MKRTSKTVALVVALLGSFWFLEAGNLEPPGAPAPTMVTLQEIYDKLDECTGGNPGTPCGVAQTGQTGCWSELGAAIACAGTGQDGEYQAGASASPRFTDNGDGTVTDNLTGLTWLRNANCFGTRIWTLALSNANNLASGSCGLTDGSVAGDWRLPNIREISSLVDYDRFDAALPAGHPFTGVQLSSYWTSTTSANDRERAWGMSLRDGATFDGFKDTTLDYVWPVRGGL